MRIQTYREGNAINSNDGVTEPVYEGDENKTEECANCGHWFKNSDHGENTGECRNKPPHPYRINNFPVTFAWAWCGEFKGNSK